MKVFLVFWWCNIKTTAWAVEIIGGGILSKYSFEEIKEKFREQFIVDFEPELTLFMYDKKYMIIFYPNKCSFLRCGYNDGSGEVYYNSLDELYNAETVDGILLKRDWNDIENFECWEYSMYHGEDF